MITAKAIITTAGATLLQNASAASPLTISKIVVAQAIASPVAGQIVNGSVDATSLSLTKYTADSNLHVARNLTGKSIAIRFKIPDYSFDYWVVQLGIYSGTTLIGIASVPAQQRTGATGAVEYTALLPVTDLAKVVKNRNSMALISKSSMNTFQNDSENELSNTFPLGQEGSTFQAISNTNAQALRLVTLSSIVENSTEYDQEKARVVSMADVFNTWYRFSHQPGAATLQPALPDELSSWAYDSANDLVKSTTNSSSLIGFVSRKKYDQYTLQVELSSTANDDDDIGIVIAFAKDETGFENKLCLVRSPGGFGHCFSLVKNYNSSKNVKILYRSTQIAWGNGGYGTLAADAGYVSNTAAYFWSALGACRVKVVRNGDIITISSSEFGASNTVYKAAADFTIDLSQDPDLAIFRGPRAYGYQALSQADATFKVLEFTGDVRKVIDISSNKVATQNADKSWTEQTYADAVALTAALGRGRLHHNPVSGKTYSVTNNLVRRIF